MSVIRPDERNISELREIGGTDAQGEVTVRVTEGNHTVVGKGSSTDIIEASAKAYINALNRLNYKQTRLIESL